MTTPTDPSLYYRIHVFCCTNRRPDGHARGSCAAHGSEELRDYLKSRAKELRLDSVRINNAGCLDRCELGPVMVIYPEGIWYSYETRQDIDEIVQTHLVDGGRVTRLQVMPQDRIKTKA